MIAALAAAASFLIVAMSFAWIVQRRSGNSGWIDTIWSFSVGVASLVALWLLPSDVSRRVLIAALVALWSARLGAHIFSRTRRGKDDPRYAQLMAEWGAAAPRRLFWFLQAQALAGVVLVLAVALAASSAGPALTPGAALLAALALFALVGEAVADAQLAACKRRKPANGICETGLWAWSRHPNYFFEWLFWTAIAGLAVAPPAGMASWLAVAAPAMMYVLLRHGSGVPHLEAHMRRTRPEAFAAYAARVPAFFPKFRR